jgi:selenoprotein W-related protein
MLERGGNCKVKLIASGGGVFEISVDGRLLHSKKQTGQFPDEAALAKRLCGG